MFELTKTNSFKRDIEKYKYDPRAIERLTEISRYLLSREILPVSYQDHALKWDFSWYRECHILPNILLIYKINEQKECITFSYIWSHSDIFW